MFSQRTLLFIILSSILTLYGCGGGSSSESNTPPSSDSAPDNTVPEDEDNNETEKPPSGDGLSSLEQALKTGNINLLKTSDNVAAAAIDFIDKASVNDAATRLQLLADITDLDWNPTHDAGFLRGELGKNIEVLNVNADQNGDDIDDSRALVVAGTHEQSKFIMFGGHPFRNLRSDPSLLNEDMLQFLHNTMTWLTEGKEKDLRVTLAQSDNSYWFRDEPATREWLEDNYNEGLIINNANTCNGAALKTCLQGGSDLLIISQFQDAYEIDDIMAGVNYATANGIPVLYLHHDGGITDLGSQLFNNFDVAYAGDNRWPQSTIKNTSVADADRLPGHISAIKNLLNHINNENFSVPLASCAEDRCANDESYANEFSLAANSIKSMFDTYDQNGIRIFDSNSKILEKHLVLLADQIRQDISYPMSVDSTPTNEFLKAYFADHLIYISRDINPVPEDLGNYSRSDFSRITPTSKTITLTSKQSFRSSGVYALPGQTVRVTRLDNNEVDTSIRVNSVRSGATHEWDSNGYTRPKYLASQNLAIKFGESIVFTSPYGGPIHITFNTNDIETQFTFENIGEHAFWSGSQDDTKFTKALADDHYDWAEIATNSFEVHSKADRIVSTLETSYWNTAAELAEAIKLYATNYTHVLAGFQGPDITPEPEVHGWAETEGLAVATVDIVKHVNADQATCGGACSGNPYDTYGSFHPVEHGNLHEIGHGLQTNRFLFSFGSATQGGHGATNFYSFYARQQFFEATGIHSTPGATTICEVQTGPAFRGEFAAFVEAAKTEDPGATIAAIIERTTLGTTIESDPTALTQWGSYDYNYFVWDELQLHARRLDILNWGQHLIARVHIIEREFNSALASDEAWINKRDNLGFSTYSLDEAKAISTNDFILIAASRAVNLDYRQPLNLMGVLVSDKANAQVAISNHTSIGREFITRNDACSAKVKDSRNLAELAARGVEFEMKSTEITADAQWPWPETEVSLNKAIYAIDEAITISYAHAPGNSRDWIAIYNADIEPTGSEGRIEWHYINGNIAGSQVFSGLDAGKYVAYLFENNKYTVLAEAPFLVE
ncbi:ImpA family metalloprotease [Psychromonas algarum]|uniref:ImpA family metalloprotease n=1 Tax=Psychromonas algarum TaxID=2555643 RepID=UPI001419E3C8|nr:ImpA family metalloprotease [Psychromonas sp. RZ22]